MTSAWNAIRDELRLGEKGQVLHVPIDRVEHPLDVGMETAIGLWKGQRADYRWSQDNCTCLHVHDFGNHYEVHLDEVDPDCHPVLHLLRDAPVASIAGGTALGALVGGLLGRSKGGVLAGAAVGALVSSIFVGLSDSSTEPDNVVE